MKKMIMLAIAMIIALSANAQGEVFWLGADISRAAELEAGGHTWKNWHGEERECTALMKEMGMNAIRLRVCVDPSSTDDCCNKEAVLAKALRAKALGMELMLDLQYADWWSDPAKQDTPQPWKKMSYKKMTQALSSNTTEVLGFLKANGITPRWVQAGSESTNAQLWSLQTDAVKAMFPDAAIVILLSNGNDNAHYDRVLKILKNEGCRWDMIGMTLYPYLSMEAGKMLSARQAVNECMKSIRLLTKKYDCDAMIAETGFEVDEQNAWKMEEGRLLLAELIHRSKQDTSGRCKGIFYNEPEHKPSQYKLSAFTENGFPTAIMRAYINNNVNDKELIANYDRRLMRIETSAGPITVELYNETPVHRDNFLRFANSGALNGTFFHRVIKNFMIQGGDPQSKDAPATSVENPAPLLGNADIPTESGETTLPAEIVYPKAFHKRGALAAAREGDEENPELRSGSSEFYIVWGNSPASAGRHPYVPMLPYYDDAEHNPGTPWLDGGYTVFGEVIEGLDIIGNIQSVATDPNDRPLTDIRILNVVLLN